MVGLDVAGCSLNHIIRITHRLWLVRRLRMLMRPVGCCEATADCKATEHGCSQARAMASCHDCTKVAQALV